MIFVIYIYIFDDFMNHYELDACDKSQELGFIQPGTTVVADNIGGCQRVDCGDSDLRLDRNPGVNTCGK